MEKLFSKIVVLTMMLTSVSALWACNCDKQEEQKRIKLRPFQIVSDSVNTDLSANEARVRFLVYRRYSEDLQYREELELKTSVNGVWKTVNVDSTDTFEYMVEPGNYAFNFMIDEEFYEIIIPKIEVKVQHDLLVRLNFTSRPKQEPIRVVAEKPVIYIYTDEQVNLDISVKPKGEFTFTYPTMQGTWSGKATGSNFEISGKSYPYLFWEAEVGANLKIDWSKSSVISSDNVITYLEQLCDKLALNDKEKTDLITYWGPRMMNYDKMEVVALSENVDQLIGSLEVSNSDFIISRFYMVFRETENQAEKINLDHLKKVKRHKKMIFEWGGSDVTKSES